MAVYQGREGGKLVFQPRLRHWFEVNLASGGLPRRYQGMYLDEVYDDLEVTPREVWGPRGSGTETSGYYTLKVAEGDDVEVWVRHPSGRSAATQSEADYIVTECRTSRGSIRQVQRPTEHGVSLMNVEYYLKDLGDVEIYKHMLQGRSYKWDEERYNWGYRRFGDRIPLRVNLQRAPLMWLIVGLMGFQRTVTMLWRHPTEMGELMRLLELDFMKQVEAYRGRPVTDLCFNDNMHQDLCPPPYFRRYLIPFFRHVIPEIHAQGMYTTSHWDGFVKQLLPLAQETGLDGLECVTTLPQGDVTIEEAKEGMGNMFLRDGIPAVMFCPWTSVDDLRDHVKRLIESFYPRLILGISDLLPANADIERIRVVNLIVQEFNESL
jgi:hypothetical protein